MPIRFILENRTFQHTPTKPPSSPTKNRRHPTPQPPRHTHTGNEWHIKYGGMKYVKLKQQAVEAVWSREESMSHVGYGIGSRRCSKQ